MIPLQACTLTGSTVILRPLAREHAQCLYEIAQPTEIWQYLPTTIALSPKHAEAWIEEALLEQQAGMALPFLVEQRETGLPLGSTRFLTYSAVDRGVEIGFTWYTPAVWRTRVNTECKYLLLTHAFETLQAIRVCFKTHHRNERSQRAIERLGAIREGIWRNHRIQPDGSYRHSVFYSIIDEEWPTVKTRLEAMLAREAEI